MKYLRILLAPVIVSFVLILQSCGGGGGTNDTAGSLTISNPTASSNGDGTYTVSASVTYTPPNGKSAQGVVVTTTGSDSFGISTSDNRTLTSGSNSVNYSFTVDQHVGVANHYSIASNIGGMTASVGIVIPAIAPISALPIDFLAGEAATPGTTKTTTIAGGVGTYILTSPATVDGVLTVSLSGSTLTVKYISATTSTAASTFVTVRDGFGSTFNIPVSYFK